MEGQTEVICNSQRQNDAEGNRHSQTPRLFYIPGTFVSIYFGDKASIEYDFLSITPQYMSSLLLFYILRMVLPNIQQYFQLLRQL